MNDVVLSGADKKLLRKNYYRFLIPTIISMVTHSLYCLADVFFVGIGVGKDGLAALNIALPVFTVYTTFSILIGVGASTTISIFKGEGDTEKIDTVFTQAMLTVTVISVLFAVLGTIFIRDIAYAFGATEKIVNDVVDYMLPINCAAPVYFLASSLSIIVRGDNDPKLVMFAGIAGDATNIVLDYIFVVLMKMGTFGAGLATILGPSVVIIILMFHFILKKNSIKLTVRIRSNGTFWRMIRNGIGSGLMETSAGFVIFAFNVVLIDISGEDAVAVFSIISNIGYVSKGIFNGIAQAAQPMISENYGRKNYSSIKLVNSTAFWTAVVFSVLTYTVILLFPGEIISFFISDGSDILSMGIPAVLLYFISLPFTAFNIVMMYFFQSIERIKYTAALAFFRGILFIIASLLIFAYIWGLTGVWLSLAAAEALSFILFLPQQIRLYKDMAKKPKKQKKLPYEQGA